MEDKIKQFAITISASKERCMTEEATKHSLILPFLNILGYNVFDPQEVVPEFIADIGIKKGEKIDYAIFKNGQPTILIECKHHDQVLNIHQNQLLRYFHTTKAKFGILTNGTKYKFYSDLEEPNKMDETPFLEIDLENIKLGQIDELKKFHKDNFDAENIVVSASSLKYINKFKLILASELSNPSEEFIKYFAKKVLDGKVLTSSVISDFGVIVKKGTSQYIAEIINSKLKTALNQQEEESIASEALITKNEIQQIVTTDEEMEGFYIIKSFCREYIDSSRIQFKDTLSYFTIIVDGKVTKWIVRLALNTKIKYLILPSGEKFEIASVENLYNYKKQIVESVQKLI